MLHECVPWRYRVIQKTLDSTLEIYFFGNEYINQNIDLIHSRVELISIHENFISSKSVE